MDITLECDPATTLKLENHSHSTPEASAERLKAVLVNEFIKQSAIPEDVFAGAVTIVPDIEFDELTKEVTATPIADLLGRRYTRFGQEAKANQLAAVFWGEDGEPWQLKTFDIIPKGKRSGDYIAPTGGGDKPYLPPIPPRVIAQVAEEYGLPLPAEGEKDWDWVKAHPEIPAVLTEGAKKALAAIGQGVIAIALYGVDCGYKDLAIKDALLPYVQGRSVTLAYDQDPRGSNANFRVAKAIQRMSWALTTHAKAKVSIAQWDAADGKGLDDLIAQGGPAKFQEVIGEALPFADYLNSQHRDILPFANQIRDEQYLSDIVPPESKKAIFINSAKCTGKTEVMGRMAKSRQADYRRAYPIVHRVQLGIALAHRYDVDYFTNPGETKGALGMVLTIDSIRKIDPETARGQDLYFDEFEQLMWELLDSSRGHLGSARADIISHLASVVKAAIEGGGRIVVGDADLSRLSVEFVKGLAGITDEECYIVVNKYSPIRGKRDLLVYDKPESLLLAAQEAVANGQRVLITTGAQTVKSTYSSTNLGQYLSKAFPDKRVLVIDAETVADPKHPAYGCMGHLDAVLAQYDVVIISPVAETGISIDKPYFDAVFGFGQGTQTVEQFCQSIERYRPHVPRHIWVRERAPNNCYIAGGETSPYAIMKSNKAKVKALVSELGIADTLTAIEDANPHILQTWADLGALHNQGKYHYRQTILKKLKADGYNIIHTVDGLLESELKADEAEQRRGLALLNAATGEQWDAAAESLTLPLRGKAKDAQREVAKGIKDISQAAYEAETQAIAETANPDDVTYEKLKKKTAKTKQERYQERKGDLCRALATDDVTQEEIVKCDDGWISQLTLHYYFTTGREFLQARDTQRVEKLAGETGQTCAKDAVQRTKTLQVRTLEILGFERFISGIGEFTKDGLSEWFETKILPYRKNIKEVLGVAIGEKDTAITFVQRVLKKMGLALTYLGRFGERGKTQRTYGPANINPDDRQAVFTRWQARDAVLYQSDTVSTQSLLLESA